jgi:hypothetical protein
MLLANDLVNPIANSGALSDPVCPLSEHFFAISGRSIRDVTGRDDSQPQQHGQLPGIDLVGLDLRLGNQPNLIRIGNRDGLNRLDLFQYLAQPCPVQAALEDDLHSPCQRLHHLAEGKRVVVFDASFQHDYASVVLDTDNRIPLVIVYASVVHDRTSVRCDGPPWPHPLGTGYTITASTRRRFCLSYYLKAKI